MEDKENMKKPKKRSATVCGYPISIFFIVVNEFCERFSYYGMRAVLVLYLKFFLQWDNHLATTIYHTFVALCYLTPILGAIIADSWLGKFKTIIYLSIVYAVGQVIMAVSAISDITDKNQDGTPDNMPVHVALSMVGLLLIALGTGGIKPCVAAFGGDQFEDHQEKQRSTFFSIFYLSINAGSLLSTFITPILRAQKCGINTQQSCYPLAFGVPAALMVVALVVFIVGSGMYTKTAPQGNIMLKVFSCMGYALWKRFEQSGPQFPRRTHWMDWAEEKYDKLLIAQVKMVLKVLFLYIPLPMFWALFDQQGSRWTLQATNMNGNFGLFTIQPDQMQTMNPILILVLVPIMDGIIYPLIAKCNLNFTPLKRMTVGMFLAALAFIAAALVQIQIDTPSQALPPSKVSQVKFINTLDTTLDFKAGEKPLTLAPFAVTDEYMTFDPFFILDLGPQSASDIFLQGGSRYTIAIIENTKGLLEPQVFSDLNVLPEGGFNEIRFYNGYNSTLSIRFITIGYETSVRANYMSHYVGLLAGEGNFQISDTSGNQCEYSMTLGTGSSYTLLIPSTFTFGENCQDNIKQVMDIESNSIHLAWQIPQYFLMTAGEVVFSVTGLEFSYSQAPSNMKSVLQAGWLLTVAVGNIIVLIVAEAARLPEKWAEYILFASLLVVVCIAFSVMAYFYTYTDAAEIEAQFAQMEPEDKEERKSVEMVRKDSDEKHSEGRRSSDSSTESSPDVNKQTKI